MKSLKTKVKFLSQNRSYEPLYPKGLVIHETATPGATAENSFNYFNSGYRDASAHGFVDWNEYIQMIPYTEVAWHAGYTANHMYIGIELCHPETKNEVQFNAVWRNAVEVASKILEEFNLSYKDITTHHAVSLKWGETDHTDPTGYFLEYGKTIDDFIKDVKSKMEGDLSMTQYEELKKEITEIKERLVTYKYIDDNSAKISPDANDALKAAVDKGFIAYGKNGFEPGLTKDTIRMIIYQYRMGLF